MYYSNRNKWISFEYAVKVQSYLSLKYTIKYSGVHRFYLMNLKKNCLRHILADFCS